MSMRILITGAIGFLGSHLSLNLLEAGHKVFGVDDLSTSNHSNITNLTKFSNFHFFEHDVRNEYYFDVDYILNFACPASPIHYQSNPVKTIETSFYGMKNALSLAKKLSVPIIQASTSEIYGDPLISPQSESYWGNVNPIGIRSCYDEGKRAAETLCFDYRRQYDVDARVIRIFNTYGPNMSKGDGRVISNLICQALVGSDLTLYGNGKQTRSFCYVSDLVKAVNKIISYSGPFETPINIGNPDEYSMLEIAELILCLTKSESKIQYMDLPLDDPKQRKPDIEKAKTLLNWYPEIVIEDGLKKTIDYFKLIVR
jgi:UDP-glucuronate decarboxylase